MRLRLLLRIGAGGVANEPLVLPELVVEPEGILPGEGNARPGLFGAHAGGTGGVLRRHAADRMAATGCFTLPGRLAV
jgi:hypothetical protein